MQNQSSWNAKAQLSLKDATFINENPPVSAFPKAKNEENQRALPPARKEKTPP